MQKLRAEGTPENPRQFGCRRCKAARVRPNLSGKRTERIIGGCRSAAVRRVRRGELFRSRGSAFAAAQVQVGGCLFWRDFVKWMRY